MRTDKLFIVVLLLVAALSLAACQAAATEAPVEAPAEEAAAEATEAPAAEPTEAPAEEPAAEAVTISMMVVDYIPDVTDTWLENEVVPAFQAEHPNINVEFIYVNWGTLDETIQGYFAAGEGADILNLGSEYVAEYGDRLAPLNSYFEGWDGLEHFLPATLDTVTWEGELRGIPWLTAPRAYMYRADALADAGFDEPPTTFEEVIQFAGAATIIENNALVRQGAMPLDDWQEYISLIWSLGGEIYKEDGTPNFDSPEARAALEFMYNRRRAVLPNETIAGLPEATGSRLASGEVGYLWANLWGAPATSDPLWEDQIVLSPGFTDPAFDGGPVVQVFNDWLAVAGYSQHVEEAAAFLMFLGSAENLNTYNAAFGSFPPRDDAWFGFVENPVMLELGDLMAQYGRGFADIRETAQFREILMAEMPLYFSDAQDLDTTLQNIQEQYTEVLEEAGRIP